MSGKIPKTQVSQGLVLAFLLFKHKTNHMPKKEAMLS